MRLSEVLGRAPVQRLREGLAAVATLTGHTQRRPDRGPGGERELPDPRTSQTGRECDLSVCPPRLIAASTLAFRCARATS